MSRDFFPMRPFRSGSLLDEMKRELNEFFNEDLMGFKGAKQPKVDVLERNDAYVVKADLPGMKKDQLEISFDHGILTIKGNHNEETETSGERFLYKERKASSFIRQLPIGENVVEENISASYKDGVLEIVLPKSSKKSRQRIINID
ncbi:Hsp20/alpha crystallin family protein [Microaerobacter geothermalis]|uniref:Hsp20/alpha crystallin family protein n=1 Tax=Microaerobacter geothermalis TaxID=674972 RepID=UPI001F362A96|nr:Hsp20/alpha crystallin family protein [Microaerobacter geothermalis]MCF6092487.1 Hsp20/alpha crystallin family protein [Microaerobacter geothermalis]